MRQCFPPDTPQNIAVTQTVVSVIIYSDHTYRVSQKMYTHEVNILYYKVYTSFWDTLYINSKNYYTYVLNNKLSFCLQSNLFQVLSAVNISMLVF
jgi:hypothetical protein